MAWMVKNIKDDRCVLKHKQFDRFYVSDPIRILDNDHELKLFTTEDINEACDVMMATKMHWAGINADGWKVVEAFG